MEYTAFVWLAQTLRYYNPMPAPLLPEVLVMSEYWDNWNYVVQVGNAGTTAPPHYIMTMSS